MEHLEPSQFLDLDQPRQLGPLFDQAKLHLGECPACRKAWLECQALKALALEASLLPDSRLRRRALQEARKVEVEVLLGLETGPEAAREILLSKRRGESRPSITPLLVALLAMAGLGAIYFYSRHSAQPLAPAKPLPFEFQENAAAPAESPTAEAAVAPTPALPEAAREEDRKLDNEARRMLLAHLKENSGQAAEIIAAPARSVASTPVHAAATAEPEREEEPSVDFHGSTIAAAAGPPPESPQPSLVVQEPRFSPRLGGSAGMTLLLPALGEVEIRVFDTNGKSVKLLADGNFGPGPVAFRFGGIGEDGAALPPGTYYARVMTRWFSRVEPLEIVP